MNFNLEEKTLTLFLEGELNSYNAEDTEKEIDSILEGKEIERVVLDMEKLRYISSAGLRIVVRLKKLYDDTRIIKAQEAVYEVFDMVGFTDLMSVEKLS